MLKKETIQKIAALLKIKEADLEAAIKDEQEKDLPIDEKLTTMTESELTVLGNNKYNEGKKAGVEMEIKAVREELGLDFQGKTIKGLLDVYGKKVMDDAKIEPNKQVTELQGQLTTLRGTIKTLEQQVQAKDSEVMNARINSELYRHIPAPNESGPALGQDDVIQLMRANGYEFKLEDGTMKAFKDGKMIQTNTAEPVPMKDVVTGFLKAKKLVQEETPPPSGRGGGNQKPTTVYTKLSQLTKEFEESGKSLLGEEFSSAVKAAQEANKDFDLSS